MIDTVILSLPRNQILAFDDIQKGVLPWDLQSKNKVYLKFIRNPSLQEKNSGNYFPRLTGYKRKYESIVKIEFSIPKLLYGNNLDEVTCEQFGTVVDTLKDRLYIMGIKVESSHLEQAKVTAVHYSKNIELKGGYSAQYVIRELNKVNLSKRFDFTRARYMNEGQSLYVYSVAHSVVIYDKIADLLRDKKRAIDKEQLPSQLSLFDNLKGVKEILRFEVRLSQRQKINNVFKKLQLAENPNFHEVFSADKSQKVLEHYWETIFSKSNILLFAPTITPKSLLNQIILQHQNIKTKKAIYLMGLILLAKEEGGLRDLRALSSLAVTNRSWYRIWAELRTVSSKLGRFEPRDWYQQIERSLSDYEPFRVDDDFAL